MPDNRYSNSKDLASRDEAQSAFMRDVVARAREILKTPILDNKTQGPLPKEEIE